MLNKDNNNQFITLKFITGVGSLVVSGLVLSSVFTGEINDIWWLGLGVIMFLLGVSTFYDLIKK